MFVIAAFLMALVVPFILIRIRWNPQGRRGRKATAIGYDLFIAIVFVASVVLFIIIKQWLIVVSFASYVALVVLGVNPLLRKCELKDKDGKTLSFYSRREES